MTDDQLHAYAIAGVTSRLAALEVERTELQALLAQLTAPAAPQPPPRRNTMSADARKRIGDAARRRWAAYRETTAAADASSADAPEVARVLPRRGRVSRIATPAAPTLPPMPRLVKARLS